MTQKTFQIVFYPNDLKEYSDNVVLTGDFIQTPINILVLGNSEIKDIETYNYTTQGPERWDYISYKFYNSFEYVEELIEANKHIPFTFRKAGFIPANIKMIIPTLEQLQAQTSDTQTTEENFPNFIGG